MNRERDTRFIIPVKGLSAGKHKFDFAIGKEFFEEFEDGKIHDASLVAIVELEKSASLIILNCSVKGSLITDCDRCLGELEIPVDITPRLVVKFVRTQDEPEDDEVMILEPGEAELDIRQFLYDYICLSLPIRTVHRDGECDPEMVSKLQTGGNSSFATLKDLLNNNS